MQGERAPDKIESLSTGYAYPSESRRDSSPAAKWSTAEWKRAQQMNGWSQSAFHRTQSDKQVLIRDEPLRVVWCMKKLRAVLNQHRIHVNFGEFRWIQWWFRSTPQPAWTHWIHWIQLNSENFTEISAENRIQFLTWIRLTVFRPTEFRWIQSDFSAEFNWIHLNSPKIVKFLLVKNDPHSISYLVNSPPHT